MHPALSIILFSTLTGMGYGLGAVLGLGLLQGTARAAPLAYGVAIGLIILGLLCSTAHLRHPERAWRAFSQWRSSWLSREGVAAMATFVPLAIAAGLAIFLHRHSVPLGLLGAVLCALTVFCTSMIYASLKTVTHWHTILTPLVFLTFAAASGLYAAVTILALTGELRRDILIYALVALIIAGVAKAMWWSRARRVKPRSTSQSATGLGDFGPVRLLEAPHVNDNYLTREMGYRIARKHADRLRAIAILSGALVPAIALALAVIWPQFGLFRGLLVTAAGFQVIGLLVERWLFFAQARHTVMLYYGDNG
jgi:DMSO reductase anchor subunit